MSPQLHELSSNPQNLEKLPPDSRAAVITGAAMMIVRGEAILEQGSPDGYESATSQLARTRFEASETEDPHLPEALSLISGNLPDKKRADIAFSEFSSRGKSLTDSPDKFADVLTVPSMEGLSADEQAALLISGAFMKVRGQSILNISPETDIENAATKIIDSKTEEDKSETSSLEDKALKELANRLSNDTRGKIVMADFKKKKAAEAASDAENIAA